MPSFALQSVAIVIISVIAIAAFVDPAVRPVADTYPATVKIICGMVAIAGSIYLSRAISLTLLRSGGTAAFRAAYVAAAALCGPGLAEILSVLRPSDIRFALAAYCVISVVSGVLWVRFYGRAA